MSFDGVTGEKQMLLLIPLFVNAMLSKLIFLSATPPEAPRLVQESMHPLVRKLYKEAIYVGRDYPLGLDKVRKEWKKAIRNPKNCPSCYNFVRSAKDDGDHRICNSTASDDDYDELTVAVPKRMHCEEYPNPDCERELRKAVGKGRYMIREMIGVIQLKKYRSLKRRYSDSDYSDVSMLREKLETLQKVEDKAILETRDDISKEDI